MKHFFNKEIHHASLWIPLAVVVLIVVALSLLYTQVGSALHLGASPSSTPTTTETK